ncbi:MAG: hypothetical protein NUV57_01010, partial [archaeon]|nr:hypothetical protein [archaeon]
KDDFGNIARAEKNVRFLNPEALLPVEIEVVKGVNTQYSRGEEINLSVEVREEGALIDDAVVKAIIGGNETELVSEGNGSYNLKYVIPADFRGESLQVVMLAQVSGLIGRKVLESKIKKEALFVNVIQPVKKVFSVGEQIDFEFNVTLENGVQIETLNPILVINGIQVETEKSNGSFIAKYTVENEKEINVSVNVQDSFGNSGSGIFNASVSGYSLNYYFSQYWIIILAVGLTIIIGLISVIRNYRADKKVEFSKSKEKEITANIINIQERYFKLGALSRTKYDELMLKYEQDLQAIKKERSEKK